MQLYLNTSSPYARVVRVCLYEKELMERTELCCAGKGMVWPAGPGKGTLT